MRAIVHQNDSSHFETPNTASKKLDSERVAAMAMAAAVLAARVAALGEGLPRIERHISPLLCGAKRPLARARLIFPSRDGLAMERSMPREPYVLSRHALRS